MKNTSSYEKWQALQIYLKEKKKLALACSGGLDSRLLAYAMHVSGIEYKILHIEGKHIPQSEENVLADFSKKSNIQLSSFSFSPLELKEVRENGVERCYYCKKALFSFLLSKAENMPLCDGTNVDDLSAYRPGLRALKELEILSPFVEMGINKQDIRTLAEELKLPHAKQPSQACLLTRFNYGIVPTDDMLLWLDRAEEELKQYINVPFRLRCVKENSWELHIEVKEDEKLQKSLENKILENVKSFIREQAVKIIFMPSLHAYFDTGLKK